MYEPQVDDYVIWDRGEYGRDEGWVYFVCDEYITIETHVKPRPVCEYTSEKKILHQMIHTLLLCYKQDWEKLEYVTNRREEQLELF